MEIKETKMFNFNFIVGGQNFGFGVCADSRECACENLSKNLAAIIEELKGAINAKKASAAS